MIYNRKEFAERQKELKERISILNKYYKKDVNDYLYSLVNLDETIFKDPEFLDNFGSLDIIYELMKFNIMGRIYNLIDNKSNLKQNNIISNDSENAPVISFKKGFEVNFDIVNADFRKRIKFSNETERKPSLIIKNVTDKTENNIENLQNLFDRKEEVIKELEEESKTIVVPKRKLFQKKETNRYNTISLDKLKYEREELENIKRKILYMEKYGHLESNICNEISEMILDDFGIKEDDFTKIINRSLIKQYKNIDIIKRLR